MALASANASIALAAGFLLKDNPAQAAVVKKAGEDVARFIAFSKGDLIEAIDADDAPGAEDDKVELARDGVNGGNWAGFNFSVTSLEGAQPAFAPADFDRDGTSELDSAGNYMAALGFLCLLRHCAPIDPICSVPTSSTGAPGVPRDTTTGFLQTHRAGGAGGVALPDEADANFMAADLLQGLVHRQFSSASNPIFAHRDGFMSLGSPAALAAALPVAPAVASKDSLGLYLAQLMNFIVSPTDHSFGEVSASVFGDMGVESFSAGDWSDLLRPGMSGSRLGKFNGSALMGGKKNSDGVSVVSLRHAMIPVSSGEGGTIAFTLPVHGAAAAAVATAATVAAGFKDLQGQAADASVAIPSPVLVTAIH